MLPPVSLVPCQWPLAWQSWTVAEYQTRPAYPPTTESQGGRHSPNSLKHTVVRDSTGGCGAAGSNSKTVPVGKVPLPPPPSVAVPYSKPLLPRIGHTPGFMPSANVNRCSVVSFPESVILNSVPPSESPPPLVTPYKSPC